MSGHTPGPWRTDTLGQAIHADNLPDNTCLASIYTSEADARLIAAAPDLLAALKVACQALQNPDGGNHASGHGESCSGCVIAYRLFAVIAKAEGSA